MNRIQDNFVPIYSYVEWASHEPESGDYHFQGINDIFSFLDIAQEEDLLVILRLGPFIDAERDMGGLPYWLMNVNPDISLRSMDSGEPMLSCKIFQILKIFHSQISLRTWIVGSTYFCLNQWINYIKREVQLSWFKCVYDNKNFLKSIINLFHILQVENEYGSYPACDYAYTAHLRDLVRENLGDEIVLFTTDGAGVNYLKCGKIADVYATVDFGANCELKENFLLLKD